MGEDEPGAGCRFPERERGRKADNFMGFSQEAKPPARRNAAGATPLIAFVAANMGVADSDRIEIMGENIENCRTRYKLHTDVQSQYKWMERI